MDIIFFSSHVKDDCHQLSSNFVRWFQRGRFLKKSYRLMSDKDNVDNTKDDNNDDECQEMTKAHMA